MNTPKKGTLKKTTNPTYTKKGEVASSTAVVDKLKDIRQDPKNKITFKILFKYSNVFFSYSFICKIIY
jgi:hypothetical protein